MDDEESGLVMPLYWRCQELQNRLIDVKDRKGVIVRFIEENIAKFGKQAGCIEFEPEMTWFNTSQTITRSSLQGIVTVLDFFTYCCINCMHILPDLEKLEAKFPSGLAVIGVHSAKFENEKSEAQIEHAINRYNIEHPVCNDASLRLWNSLGVTCWPTLLVLNPSGIPIHVFIGEGHSSFLMEFTEIAVKYFKGNGSLTGSRIPRSIHAKAGGFNLKYPGKVNLFKDFLVISDSGNQRVLLVNAETGTVNHVVGTGSRGNQDGDFTSASFNNPQGVCGVGDNLLLVADTDNHLLRLINLQTLKVTTVGGTGVQGIDKEGGKEACSQEISSPWDLVQIQEGLVAVAAAGTHQIWMYCMTPVDWWKGVKYESGTLVRLAGSGAEENRNNSYPAKAGFAQPSGLSYDSSFQPTGAIYIADSESSTVRRLDLKDGAVKNVCGGERDPTNLFGFGDKDGAGVNAKLQHPLAVAWNPARCELYVADSYNHKIKRVTGPKNDTVTLLGDGPGDGVGDVPTARLCEPGGLAVSQDGTRLFIADTNNHAIKILDLETNSLTKLELKFPGPAETFDSVLEHSLEVGSQAGTVNLTANINHSEYKLNAEGSSSWTLETDSSMDWSGPAAADITNDQICIPLTCKAAASPTQLVLKLKLYLCHRTNGMCIARKVCHKINLLPREGVSPVDAIQLGSLAVV